VHLPSPSLSMLPPLVDRLPTPSTSVTFTTLPVALGESVGAFAVTPKSTSYATDKS